MKSMIVSLDKVTKKYQMGPVELRALDDISLDIKEGEYVAIMGPSGSGKSTLLNLLGCLDRPTEGRYLLAGDDVSQLDDYNLSRIRGKQIGFVFQSYNLIQQLNVLENIEIPMYYQGVHEHASRLRARELAALVGLGDRCGHKPTELSGGQQQRVGIARALANDPVIILADEPTGNLDSRSGAEILGILDKLHGEGKTLIIVTHDDDVARRSQRVVYLKDGKVDRVKIN